MASKRARKSKASSKGTPAMQKKTGKRQAPAAARLHEVIEQLIEAKQRGDYGGRIRATEALASFSKGSVAAELRQAAAEAQVVARHEIMVHSLMELRAIVDRLRAAA